MSIEDNIAIVRRIHEQLNDGNLDVVAELYAPDYVAHVGSRTSGLKEYKAYLANHRTAFPDWKTTIESCFGDGDFVIVRLSERGTHRGDLDHYAMGRLAPTQRSVQSTRIIIRRLANGKVQESWINADHLGILHQIGAIADPKTTAQKRT
jgi:predicted ester cyclase